MLSNAFHLILHNLNILKCTEFVCICFYVRPVCFQNKNPLISCQYSDYQQKNVSRLPAELRADPQKNECYTHSQKYKREWFKSGQFGFNFEHLTACFCLRVWKEHVFILTLLFKVTLIFDWLVMRRMGALTTSCSVFWMASASILIICQLTSLNVMI